MISFQNALDIINKEVSKITYPSCPTGLYEPIHYILSLKGKKIRPVLTLLAYNLFKENVENIVEPALGWEIFHNFTLMHDDLMDNAGLRRAQPTVHKAWNENTAILSGDAMLILAYKYMIKVPGGYLSPTLELFSETAMEVCEGQQYDMEFEKRDDVSEDEYIEMIRLKTAVLIGACLKSGAILGGANHEDAKYLYNFGMNIGLAFQIKDDLLDVYGDPIVFGKNIGGDILCNKKTYLLVNALAKAKDEVKDDLLKWIRSDNYNDMEKIRAVTEIYNTLGIKQIAEDKINYFYQNALTSLSLLGVNEERMHVLSDLAEQLMFREF